jgi:NADPH:quinone reductase-like Zn-dependent oxidoreductase
MVSIDINVSIDTKFATAALARSPVRDPPMRLYRIRRYGSREGLQMTEEPSPPEPMGRQVLMRVRASSLNFRDLGDLRGYLQAIPPGMAQDHIPVSDGAGEVVAVGPEATRFRPGDRVAATFHPAWISGPAPEDLNILGRGSGRDNGMLTEVSLLDETELVTLPPHLSFEEGATLPCAGLTAWRALHGTPTPLLPGDDVLVMGTGGVSVFALQLAKASGARVIATTTSPGKMDALRELGADVVIDASGGAGWSEPVRAATGGRGVDLVVEVVGGAAWNDSILATRTGGRISLVGQVGGFGEGLSPLFILRAVTANPIRVGSRDDFVRMNRAIAANALRPVIDRVFDFGDAPAAFQHFEEGTRVGKVVIRHG